jgi:hypothetical protein
MKDRRNASPDHPAIEAYARLRKQTDNAPRLDFALMQQMWLHVRSTAAQQPGDYAMTLLRAMCFAFLLSQGFSEQEARNDLIETMTSFEKEYLALASAIVEEGEPPMRRTRPAGNNIVPLFPQRYPK